MRAMVWIVVVLTVLLAGAFVADGVLRQQTEERIATEVAAGIPGVEQPPAVSIGGFPFLTQLMAGRLASVHVTAPTATVDGLRLDDVVVELTGVATQAPFTAEHAVMTAMASADAVQAVLSVELDLSIRDGSLVASTTVLGLPLDVVLAPRAAGREVEVDVTGFVLAGAVEYEFRDGAHPLMAREGEAFRLARGRAHRGVNRAPGATRLFLIDDPAEQLRSG